MNKNLFLLAPSLFVLSLAAVQKANQSQESLSSPIPPATESRVASMESAVVPRETADIIYINGRVITVDSANTVAQALAVKDGRILAVGATASIKKLKGTATQVVDLQGKTLIPGFIDGHSHFMGLGRSKAVDLSAPPVGTVKSIPDIVAALQAFKEKNHIKDGEWITGFGYDQDQLAEGRHPVKEDLDAAFPNNPVALQHVSGHMVLVNSYALRVSGIDSTTKNPAGGMIVRKPGTNEPTGLLQEHAGALLKRERNKKPTWEEQLQEIKDQEQFYASNGITTAQEGRTGFESLELLRKAAAADALYIDIESLPAYETVDRLLADTAAYHFGVLDHHLKLAGTKLIADGSPQGKTAYFTRPYLVDVPGCTGDDCRGIPTVTQEQFNAAVAKDFKNNIRFFVHCNGDATIDMYIKAIENADRELNTTSLGRRPVVIHAQFTRADQLDKYKELGMLPSFFTNHTFFWGDVHVRNLGKERGWFESPVKSALKRGIVITNHTDYGVTPLSQLFLLWTSVNRVSRTGQVIGPDERLTPIEGLRAITINGAYEYFEEKTKGSLEKGKLADLVILSDDPTTIDPLKIKDIHVLETIKEGKTIYRKN
ncbi:MAG: amidohydrolase [Puia sp.]|nr:amidohydrolase [Puia sp.]